MSREKTLVVTYTISGEVIDPEALVAKITERLGKEQVSVVVPKPRRRLPKLPRLTRRWAWFFLATSVVGVALRFASPLTVGALVGAVVNAFCAGWFASFLLNAAPSDADQ